MELDFKEEEFIAWWEKWYFGNLSESYKAVACHAWNARHMHDYFGEKEEQCDKCGSSIGHYPNCPDGICTIGKTNEPV